MLTKKEKRIVIEALGYMNGILTRDYYRSNSNDLDAKILKQVREIEKIIDELKAEL